MHGFNGAWINRTHSFFRFYPRVDFCFCFWIFYYECRTYWFSVWCRKKLPCSRINVAGNNFIGWPGFGYHFCFRAKPNRDNGGYDFVCFTYSYKRFYKHSFERIDNQVFMIYPDFQLNKNHF